MEEKKSRALWRKSYSGPVLHLVIGVAVAWMTFQVLVAA